MTLGIGPHSSFVGKRDDLLQSIETLCRELYKTDRTDRDSKLNTPILPSGGIIITQTHK